MLEPDAVDWPALERMFQCADYGAGFWRYVSPDIAERNKIWCSPPSDGRPRGQWIRRSVMAEDSQFSGEFTAKETK